MLSQYFAHCTFSIVLVLLIQHIFAALRVVVILSHNSRTTKQFLSASNISIGDVASALKITWIALYPEGAFVDEKWKNLFDSHVRSDSNVLMLLFITLKSQKIKP